MFKFNFTGGGKPAKLVASVAKVGLPIDDARKILEFDEFLKGVREEQAKHHAMGITSEPTLIINDKYMITGGQPVETFVDTLEKIVARKLCRRIFGLLMHLAFPKCKQMR